MSQNIKQDVSQDRIENNTNIHPPTKKKANKKQAKPESFEKQIWEAACILRGNIDASEYKSVVLGLIFLKYISDTFEEKYQALVLEGEGFEEDKDEYTAESIFFVPQVARWEEIAKNAHTPEIGEKLTLPCVKLKQKTHA